VSISSLARYRRALADFVVALPERLAGTPPTQAPDLRAVEGGLA
jgi:hypothetical protein